MKRDLDLIRKIVILLKDHEHGNAPDELKIDGFTDEQIDYHCYLLKDAELITGVSIPTHHSESPAVKPLGLTWKGHEFADNAQNETFWAQAKDKIKNTSGVVSFSIFNAFLTETIKGALKDS